MKRILSLLFVIILMSAAALTASASSLPSWYPEDEESFTAFHGENLPRVVDYADIFTDSEESELTALINKLIKKHGRYDFVIFTDVTTYGIDERSGEGIYAADFYQFNGYGIGDEYSGSVLFINLNPEDRYWWSTARGESRYYFTESNLNRIDDRIEPYMKNGKYFEAMKVYISELDSLYGGGSESFIIDTQQESFLPVPIGDSSKGQKAEKREDKYTANCEDAEKTNNAILILVIVITVIAAVILVFTVLIFINLQKRR